MNFPIRFTSSSVVLLCLCFATACVHSGRGDKEGDGGGNGNGGGENGGNYGSAALSAAGAHAGVSGAQEAAATALTFAGQAVDAVRGASALATGGTELRTFGTLHLENGQPTYEPLPADRLRIVLADRREAEVFTARMQGDVAAGGTEFLRGAHDLDVRVVLPGTGDLQLTQTAANGATAGRIVGTLDIAEVAYDVDLASTGTTLYDRGFGSLQYETQQHVQGTLRGAELTVAVDEDLHFVIVGDAQTLVSQSTRQFAGTWTVGTARYELRDGLFDRAFRNGRPNETDTVWQARGTLLRDGTPVGTIRGEVRNGAIRAVLRLGDEDVVLESFQL